MKAATLHRSDFVQQNVANTKTNTLNYISEDHTLLRKSSHTHTHTLYESSWLWKYLYLQGIYAHWLLNSFLYACVFLTSYLTIFTSLDIFVCWFLVEDLTLFFSLVFVLVMVFLLYYVYSLSFCDKKGEYFLFWTGNVLPNRSSVFCPRMAKGGVC
jgi:hypothetical protein